MPTLTPEGQDLVLELARRHGFSEEAVARMLAAVVAGNGRMAQFAHPEFGGSGQWMSGGMLMIGDLFDHALKSRVGELCTDISKALSSAESPIAAARSPSGNRDRNRSQGQSQSQNRNRNRNQGQGQGQGQSQGRDPGRDRGDATSAHLPDTPFFASSPSSSWWPEALGTPSATGTQNATRYAWFADARRLVLDVDGDVTVHDTLDHRIGGFSQQQGGGDGISMTSQHGTVDLATLPIVSRDARSASPPPTRPATPDRQVPTPARPDVVRTGSDDPAPVDPDEGAGAAVSGGPDAPTGETDAAREDPLQIIERLGRLHERGLLTDEEFSAKKGELLARL